MELSIGTKLQSPIGMYTNLSVINASKAEGKTHIDNLFVIITRKTSLRLVPDNIGISRLPRIVRGLKCISRGHCLKRKKSKKYEQQSNVRQRIRHPSKAAKPVLKAHLHTPFSNPNSVLTLLAHDSPTTDTCTFTAQRSTTAAI